MTLLQFLDFAGTAAFATSGALLAARNRLDIIGFIFIANITGIGGGTLRDLLLDAPVFWLAEWHYVTTCTVAAVITYFASRSINRGSKALLWADAVGMALFSVLGAQKATALGMSVPVAAIMGMFSACVGGIIRDVILNEVPIVFQREVYITASLVGALGYAVSATLLGLPPLFCILAGCATAFVIRALAIAFKLSIPAHKGIE
ncbi:trimeric intracellular cation channel family protein [Porticoccus sp. W117]|uniref:trimeric intracellular cation channel family protein n=1 Tax=Porticoccus sp. W117 TaxID=3054777 RepID=UPI002597A177|nr:trimeric intracellular cation channel family protein [Porticoccus sp. W117]MDM3872529.1 trimeric intracellular cation channel family protein [Porticoccus sp. W117]